MNLRDRLAGVLFRLAFRVATDEHAYWLYRVQVDYWQSPRGREVLRRIGEA